MIDAAERVRIETALKEGKLFIAMNSGKWWRARRNGKTQTWKTRPDHFSIPIKCGLRATGRLDHDWSPDNYKIED